MEHGMEHGMDHGVEHVKVEELVSGREREEMDRRQEARRIASLREIRLQVRGRKRGETIIEFCFVPDFS